MGDFGMILDSVPDSILDEFAIFIWGGGNFGEIVDVDMGARVFRDDKCDDRDDDDESKDDG